jgi:hypothetical protein
MDLYGSSGSAIAQGNMRTQAVRDLNEKIRQHNSDIADQISSLREQTQTADTINDALNTGKSLWVGSKMPQAISNYKDWKAGKLKGSNPLSALNNKLQEAADKGNPLRNAMGQNQITDAILAPRAEGSPSGLSLSEEASSVLEGQRSKLSQGIMKGVEGAVGEDALSKLGKATGAIGGLANAGIDLYQDFQGGKGFHLAGDNWEEKTGNALNLAGSIADVAGTFYPPLALIGGAADLASAAIDAIGSKVEEDKKSGELTQQQQQQTEQEVTAPAQQTIVTGRTQ